MVVNSHTCNHNLIEGSYTQHTLTQYITYLYTDSESDAMKTQPSDCQRNPAYGHFSHTDSSPEALLSGNYSENPAYNIDAHPSAPQEPTYEVIPLDMDRAAQGAYNVNCSQNPAYIQVTTDATLISPRTGVDYSQNPAYDIHSNPNNDY